MTWISNKQSVVTRLSALTKNRAMVNTACDVTFTRNGWFFCEKVI